MAGFDFDVVFIGGGPGGYVGAIKAAQLGLKTACIEKRKTLGGTCLNVGCIPSKALLEASHLYHMSNGHLANYGISSSAKIDISKMLEYKDKVISGLTKGIEGLFKKNKVSYINGFASFTDKNTVTVKGDSGEQKITSKHFVISTGSDVANIPNVTIDEKLIVSSTGALELEKVPAKLIVIGGGYIGLEMASIWARLGSKVEVVEFMDRVTPAMDAEVSKNFCRILEKQGLSFRFNTKVVSAKADSKKSSVKLTVESSGKQEELTADVVLVAVGRRPFTEGLGLDKVGVKVNTRGFIEVDTHLHTSVDNIFAIGDCVPGPMLAHKAEEEGVCVAEILAGKAGHVNYDVIPGVVYTHPEVAAVGKTEEELKAAGIEYNVGKFAMMANSRARSIDDSEGFVKILACKKTDKVLGAHIIGREAGNMIHEVAVLMEFGGSSEDLARTCHAHPTLNEAVKEAALAAFSQPIHM